LPQGQVAAYNPQAHPVLSGDGRLVLSYDVNWPSTRAVTPAMWLSALGMRDTVTALTLSGIANHQR
ncbi:hypothetical protein ACWCQ0_35750, partial [Streptomyces massasporeus]